MNALSSIEDALQAMRDGRPVLVTDDEDRENEGDVILAADTLTDEWVAWMVRHTSGYLCAPLPEAYADRLGLPLMVEHNRDPFRTAYTVSVDAAEGVTTGISAADRARTIRLLADADATPQDFIRPGHVLPLRAKDGGVLVRRGHTEAGVDLPRLAGLNPVSTLAELQHDDGTMMRLTAVLELGAEHDLPVITIEQLVQWREKHDRVERVAEARLPTSHGIFQVVGYRDRVTGAEHVALISGRGLDGDHPLVRVHSECLTGDVFGSRRCDCGPQLDRSLERVSREGGVVVYLRGHEGRGVGLLSKLQAYALQDNGFDTVDAQTELGLPIDDREYGAAGAILRDLGVERLRLMTNNPVKVEALARSGIDIVGVDRVHVPATADNTAYLTTKRDRLGHDILLEAEAASA
ncbi:bifunctional 3,4-dihydroxy-2-butanone-4-phosphate synthase/GTP cyclohydrolase II [Luteipulveratus mongoliensis]|uniref:Riboflavin biosynthesis protein RibBA n=1 Tax=Luteipulveratus mongoliensis TaxID=571913 RepID=A0A0K1JJI4_9MICO|nr:bifunctional 3,4-dihydroxy-2-butanone-4-phosphate synthase/GTP cyclohydrolase II [Luteipulveratus mongoliensis]AKU16738.1 GTP cyclohydrolase [Luteipulveratus mongoliensis]